MAAKRVTVYRSLDDAKNRKEGRVFLINNSLTDTLADVSLKFKDSIEQLAFLSGGGIVDDIELLRDDDVLLAISAPKENGSLNATPTPQPIEDTSDPASFSLRKCTVLLSPDSYSRHDWVRLNVGGKIFATSRATLMSDPSSMLARMFESDWSSATDNSGAYLFDRSPEYFEPLLNLLRHGKLILNEGVNPQGVLEEAYFFNITKAIPSLESLVNNEELSSTGHLTRREFLHMIINSSSSSILRCQGINLEGVDLSNLDLRNINFKCANLRHCDLSHSDLTNCVLERADLSYAVLNKAILQCVHMPRVIMEGACLKECSMDARLGVSTNLEGANLKSSTFDNSQMNGVNLRLASLKGACLRSCNLRYAIMAGTDMENSDIDGSDLRHANLRGANLEGTNLNDNCDLCGSDLQHANLRGANLAGVNFDGITAPLHMSQTVNVNVSQSNFDSTLQPTPPIINNNDSLVADGGGDNNNDN